jgi:hypothetical protein
MLIEDIEKKPMFYIEQLCDLAGTMGNPERKSELKLKLISSNDEIKKIAELYLG